jgi:hypothetical protein
MSLDRQRGGAGSVRSLSLERFLTNAPTDPSELNDLLYRACSELYTAYGVDNASAARGEAERRWVHLHGRMPHWSGNLFQTPDNIAYKTFLVKEMAAILKAHAEKERMQEEQVAEFERAMEEGAAKEYDDPASR